MINLNPSLILDGKKIEPDDKASRLVGEISATNLSVLLMDLANMRSDSQEEMVENFMELSEELRQNRESELRELIEEDV